MIHRALEMGGVLAEAVHQGFVLGFGTFTMRHHQGERLVDLWSSAGKAWARATSGREWVESKEANGVVGWLRVWEVTEGRNGWHVHVHFVLVMEAGSGAGDLDSVASTMYERWSAGLVANGRAAPRLVGQDWHLVEGEAASSQLAEYLCKYVEQGDADAGAAARSIGLELALTNPGRARVDLKTWPVWSILDALVETGDVEELVKWHEWEAGSKGRRQVGWSKGLRARFTPEVVEVTDEEITDRELGTAADDLVKFSEQGWHQLVRIPAAMPAVLEAAERDGTAGVVELLDELGVEHEVITERGPAQ